MSLKKKEDLLTFQFKIPRKLHDQVDEVRDLAKKLGYAYDPTDRLTKALHKDLADTLRELAEAQKAASESGVE